MSSLPNLQCNQRVKWFASVSDSGVALPTPAIERNGILLGLQLVPAGQGATLLCFVRRIGENDVEILNISQIAFVD